MRLPARRGQRPLDSQLDELGEDTRALLEQIVGGLADHYRPERTLAAPDFLPAWFLRVGAERARAVARLEVLDGGQTYFGTGFMLTPSLLMTNHHVLPSAALASNARVLFDDEEEECGRRRRPELFRTDPARMFVANARLDFALVAVEGEPGARFGTIPLRHTPAQLEVGGRVNLIQHPGGGHKRVVVHGNHITKLTQLALHYLADTEGGSSGSPVFNARWELLGLHHWGGERDNVGVRIDAILKVLEVLGAARGASPLLRELLEGLEDSGDFGVFATAGLQPPSFDIGAREAGAREAASAVVERAALDWMGGAGFVDPGYWDVSGALQGEYEGEVLAALLDAIATFVDEAGADFMVLEGIPAHARAPLQVALEARGQGVRKLGNTALLSLDPVTEAEAVELSQEARQLLADECRGRRLIPPGFEPLRLSLRRPGVAQARALYLMFIEVEDGAQLPSRAHRNELARVLGALALATGRDVVVMGALAGVLARPGLVELINPPELNIMAAPAVVGQPDVGAIAWIGDGQGAQLERIYCRPELRALRLEPEVERCAVELKLELSAGLEGAGLALLLRARFDERPEQSERHEPAQPAAGASPGPRTREIVVEAHVRSILIVEDKS